MNNNSKQQANFCPGCGYPIILMMLNKVLENLGVKKKSAMGLDIGCSLLALDSLSINTFQTHHGRVTPVMVGFKRAKSDSVSLGLTGDGGAYAIGWQNLYHAGKRDEPISVIVVNNTLYAMTGGQTAPTTIKGCKTSTDPKGCKQDVFLGPEIIKKVADKNAFLARGTVSDPKNLMVYLQKAIETQLNGHFSLLEILSLCPTNWKTKGQESLNYIEELKKDYNLGVI